jgi:2-dehydro-3-deoxyphosphogluconate aldolase/(4S)-4-hydroxy-2-oxoglutarate aldolase
VQEFIEACGQHRCLVVLRAPDYERGLAMAEAAIAGGLRLIEVTWTGAEPERLVRTLRQRHPQVRVGAGSVLTAAHLQSVQACGGQFAFSPIWDPALLTRAWELDLPYVPGALTPSEIQAARRAGATVVKLFPLEAMGGVRYLRSLQAPLDRPCLIPCGGIDAAQAADCLAAGALAVGVGGELFRREAVAAGDWAVITAIARTYAALAVIPATDPSDRG